MGVIQPITDRNVLEKMKEYLRERSLRDYLLFRVGLNFGLPVQELLNIRIEEVLDQTVYLSGNCQIHISPSIQSDIRHYSRGRSEGLLFISSNGNPVSRLHLYSILQKAAQAASYQQPVGAIGLRKTFAYWAYQEKRVLLPLLSNYLRHHTVEYTLRYIGMDDSGVVEESSISMDL